MSFKTSIKCVFLLFCIIMMFIMYENDKITSSIILCLILCWIIKDLVCNFDKYSTYDEYQSYYYGYEPYDEMSYYPTYVSTRSVSNSPYVSPYIKNEIETQNRILQSYLPNMSILLESKEKTEAMNTKKEEYIKNIITINIDDKRADQVPNNIIESTIVSKPMVTTPIVSAPTVQHPPLALPAPKEDKDYSNAANIVIFIDNTDEISEKRKKVYDAILSYLRVKFTSIAVTRMVLNNIRHIDIIHETDTVILYMKELNLMTKYCLNSDGMIEHIQKANNFRGGVTIEQYKSQSILDYYEQMNK